MRFRYLVILIVLGTLQVFGAVEDAETRFARFRQQVSAADGSAPDYGLLREAYTEFADVLRSSPTGSPGHSRAKAGLRDVFPYLRQAAYHFAKENNQEQVLRFAADYIDLSLLPGMGDLELQATPGYSVLANLAATNIYNRGDYGNALLYFQAYLSTGDTREREMAFEGLARSYYELRNYENAAYIASLGTETYPRNWNMLVVGVESCERTGNDAKLAPLLDRALSVNPTHSTLLDYKGKLLERQGHFAEAAEVFGLLRAGNEASLDYTCHHAFDLYNSALDSLRADAASVEAKEKLGQAIPLFEKILADVPYAANVANALAVAKAHSGDKEGLREMNEKLVAMRLPEVSANVIPGPETQYLPSVNPTPATQLAATSEPKFLSDVDKDIPVTGTSRPDTYVVVIGNEGYKHFTDVDYARRDGEVFADYCRKTLGVPAANIRERYDATLSEILEPFRYLAEKTRMNPGELDLIIYYAGHGVPDVSSGKAYLLPTDATGTDFESCVDLDGLYASLAEMPAHSVTLFLDACFSGATRGNEMLFKERFVEYEVEDVVTKGDVVAFAATAGNQTAMGYDEKRHGLFTYFLLKNLSDSKGDITLGQLADRLVKQVDNTALDTKNKHQTPTVNASPSLGESWKSKKL